MAHSRHLPICKAALDLAVHLENAVRRFPLQHKYAMGTELRQTSQRLYLSMARTNNAGLKPRLVVRVQLVLAVDEMKTLLTLAQEIRAFANFNELAQVNELAATLGKQSGGGDVGSGLKPQLIALGGG